MTLSREYLEQMEAHLDNEGRLSHQNAVDLFVHITEQRAITSGLLESLKFFVNLQTGPMAVEDAFPDEFKHARETIQKAETQ